MDEVFVGDDDHAKTAEVAQPAVKIVKADEVVAYLETIILYLESLQQDMITNIKRIKGETDNA